MAGGAADVAVFDDGCVMALLSIESSAEIAAKRSASVDVEAGTPRCGMVLLGLARSRSSCANSISTSLLGRASGGAVVPPCGGATGGGALALLALACGSW